VRKIILLVLTITIFTATALPHVSAAPDSTLPSNPLDQNPLPASPPNHPPNIHEAIVSKQAEAEKVIEDIKRLDLELSLATEAYNKARVQLGQTEEKLQATQIELEEAQAKYDARKEAFNQRLSAIYKNSQTNIVEIIFNAENFTDLIVRISFLARIGLQDVLLLAELKDAKKAVEEVKAQLITLRDQQLAANQELEAEKSRVEMVLAERRIILETISTEILNLIQQEEERKAQEAAALLEQAKSELANYLPQINPVVVTAFRYIGIPYKWGGETPEEGFDCSGLMMYIFAQYGINLPHSSQIQSTLGRPVEWELRPGDLVFFGNPIHHVGMYVGADYFLEAPRTGDVVKISRLSQRNDFAWARRFLPEPTPIEQPQPNPEAQPNPEIQSPQTPLPAEPST